jgi:apolipoprotein N-acyltransferase
MRVGAAAASGGLLALCFPGLNLGLAVWVWMIPLLLTLWTLSAGKRVGWRGFRFGWLAGLVFFAITFRWLWAVTGLGAMVVAGYLALYFAAWGAFAATWGNPWRDGEEGGALHSLRFALMNAAVWAGLEWLRGWLLTGFGWNGLGVAFHNVPVFAQGADLLGIAGLSMIPVMVTAVLVQTGRRMVRKARVGGIGRQLDFAVIALLLVGFFAYGVWRSQSIARLATVPVNVLLVQRNIPQSIKWQAQSAEEIYRGYAEATQRALEELEEQNVEDLRKAVEAGNEGEVELRRPDLVIWPESALPEGLWYIDGEEFPLTQWNAGYISEAVLALGNFTFITGVNEFEGERQDAEVWGVKSGGAAYNSMAFFRGDFASGRTYRKIHRVPFGEYIPLREQIPQLEKIFKFSAGAEFGAGFSAGSSHEPVMVETAGKPVGVIPAICFEDTVNRLVRKFVRPGEPQLIVNVTNDGWFLETIAAEQHVANSMFRAIELRRPMVRAANTGVSCLIDATGSMVDRKSGVRRAILDPESGRPFIEGTLYGQVDVPVDGVTTLYSIAGDTPVIVLGLAGLASGYWRSRRRASAAG